MNKRFKLLIFDWDGTIMDSEPKIVSCFQRAIAQLGFENRTPQQVSHMIGLGLKQAAQQLYPELNEQQRDDLVVTYKHYFFEESNVPTPLYPSVFDIIHQLHEAGYLLAVATGKSRRGLDRVMVESQLGHLFLTTRSAEETASKPDPLMLHEILEELDISHEDAVMIGDTEYDLQMARHANMASIAVTYGVHSKTHLEQCCQPLAWVDDFSELSQHL